MSTFVNAIVNQSSRTANGMKARQSTANAVTDLFFKIGAMRGQNVIPAWTAARVANPDLATRVALWARDVRGGAGERKIFRDILVEMSNSQDGRTYQVMQKVPELGRWDDLLVLIGTVYEKPAMEMIREALEAGNGLCAKWMPRQGDVAVKLRKHLGWTPKFYRKRLVELTKVVETQMCAKDWDNINFNHVPSVASSRYKKAFARHTDKYKEWTAALVSTDPEVAKSVKVNAGAVYPYDVLKGVINTYGARYDSSNLQHIQAQWDALPNFVGDANILPLVDVSGSMTSKAGGRQSKSDVTCLEVAVSLGLYLADKNKGKKFKDTFLTFSSQPSLLHLQGNILDKVKQMVTSQWEMSTNLHLAFAKILKVAIEWKVPESEMPEVLLILSDMQFDSCARYDDSAMEMIARQYTEAGYNVPNIVFWNLNACDNVPAKFDDKGVALVSGFSPAIVKGVLAADLDDFTPEAIMLKTIMSDRYDY